jgi:hypothetical protein
MKFNILPMKHLVIGSFSLVLIATTACKKETIASNEIVDTVSTKPYYTSVTLDGVTSTYSNNFPTIDTLATSGYTSKDNSNNGQFVISLLTSLSNNGIYANLIDTTYENKKITFTNYKNNCNIEFGKFKIANNDTTFYLYGIATPSDEVSISYSKVSLNGVTKITGTYSGKVTLFGEQNFAVSPDPQIYKDPSKMKQVGVSGKFGYTDVVQ